MDRDELQAKVRTVLEKYYPEFCVSDMEPAYYWKSLEEYQAGRKLRVDPDPEVPDAGV